MRTARLLEAVPNFSEGRDPAVILAIVDAMKASGADILDWSADADHHRSVVTLVGSPRVVEEAAVAGARAAIERIDLTRHEGVHPRIGALDVLPFVPVAGATLADARDSARRVGQRLARELGIPVYFYGAASEPPGRPLSALRRGGFETLRTGWPAERPADVLPERWPHAGAHPTAGVTCVGARPVLLAWNLYLAGVEYDAARQIARSVRESGGGFLGVRALALRLPSRNRLQISMNIENLDVTQPMDVFRRIEELVHARGGAIEQTEIVGMLPDALLWGAAADRLRLSPDTAQRLLSQRLVEVLSEGERTPQDA